MPMIHVRIGRYPLLTEICGVISRMRGDNVWQDRPDREYPAALMNLVRNRGLAPSMYRYWGSMLLRDLLVDQVTPEAKLIRKMIGSVGTARRPEALTREKEEHLTELCGRVKEELTPFLRHYGISEVIELKLYPVETAPPPQLGRFGASLRRGASTTVFLGFGAPPLTLWDEFGLDAYYFARGALHYLTKEWLEAKSAELGEWKDGFKLHLLKLIPILMLTQIKPGLYDKLEDVFNERELPYFRWSMSEWSGEAAFGDGMLANIRRLNEQWPPAAAEHAPTGMPRTLVETIQERSRVVVADPEGLLADTRWIEDFYEVASGSEDAGVDGERSFVVLSWGTAAAREVCDRHGIRLHADGTVTCPQGSEARMLAADRALCLLIDDDPSGEGWRLVLIGPPSQAGGGHRIDPSLMTQLHVPLAMFDAASGRRVV